MMNKLMLIVKTVVMLGLLVAFLLVFAEPALRTNSRLAKMFLSCF